MADIDKVIKGLECCTTGEVRCFCKNKLCPYFGDIPMCERRLMKDSLELLKEYAVIKETISDEIHETAKMFRREG